MKELATLHDRHLNRPTLDDNVQEEHSIEIMTQDITQVCYVFTFEYTLVHIKRKDSMNIEYQHHMDCKIIIDDNAFKKKRKKNILMRTTFGGVMVSSLS